MDWGHHWARGGSHRSCWGGWLTHSHGRHVRSMGGDLARVGVVAAGGPQGPQVSVVRGAQAWWRSQRHPRGVNPLQGGYCRSESSDLLLEGSD